MILNIVTCIPNKGLNYLRFTLQTPFRKLEQCLQFGQVITRNIDQISNFHTDWYFLLITRYLLQRSLDENYTH